MFTRDQLLDGVWGTERFVTPRSVDVYVRRLREKIETDPQHPAYMKTIRGAGYLSKPVRARLFWNLGLTYLALLLAAFLAIDFYSSHTVQPELHPIRLRRSSLAFCKLAQARPPHFDNASGTRANWTAVDGAERRRASPLSISTGRVLADSARDPEGMENHSNRPEFQQAFASGEGQSVRHSATLSRIYVPRGAISAAGGPPVVIRLALPLAQVDASLADLQPEIARRVPVDCAVGGVALFLFLSRSRARRTAQAFFAPHRRGRFSSFAAERPRDELADLTEALNETAARMDRTIRSLSGERNRSSAILRSMVEGVAVIDAQERLVFSNRAFSEILNVDSASSEGRPLIEVVRNSELLGLIRRALQRRRGLADAISRWASCSSEVSRSPLRPLTRSR